jgi:hypothetical protein
MRFFAAMIAAVVGCGHPLSSGEAASLAAGTSDSLVVNSRHPTPLRVRAFDAAGQVVQGAQIRYERVDGDSLTVTQTGDVTCARSGDMTVRATLGRLSTRLVVQCRLVEYVRLPGPLQFVLGDTALSRPFALPLAAYDANGHPIVRYTAALFLKDSGIARLHGLMLSPQSRGITGIGAHIGDRDAWIGLHVYQRVGDLAALDTLLRVPDRQRLFAAPLRLSGGDLLRQRLPRGQWMLTMLPESDTSQDRILLRVEGGRCTEHLFGSLRRWGCTAGDSTTVVVYRSFGHATPRESTGYLLVRWLFG